MRIKLESIRNCLEGAVPGTISTCAPDGTPNIAYLSQIQYVDGEHVALSYQFFNTTRRNILASPYARLAAIDPHTAAHYRLSLQYLRTEQSGPLFESMKAKLAGIASHTGMGDVFRLLGSDIYRVLDIEQVPGQTVPLPRPERNLLAALRAFSEDLCGAADLDDLFARVLTSLERNLGIQNAMLLMVDETGRRLYTIASLGYSDSGVGSEIAFGEGVIGVAARERTPIRISHFTSEYNYSCAIRDNLALEGCLELETKIPLPGLAASCSQLAVPIKACDRLIGVLYVESQQDMRFGYDDEDALVTLAGQLGAGIRLLQQAAEAPIEATTQVAPTRPPDNGGKPLAVRRYAENDSVFLDGNYLIKGVAGAIFWTLIRDFVELGRIDFNNRELRLDRRIRLPDLSDNLEARLILLERRLAEHAAPVRIEKTGRGRFRLKVTRAIELFDA